MSRLLLQICTGLLALIPIVTSMVTLLGVKDHCDHTVIGGSIHAARSD